MFLICRTRILGFAHALIVAQIVAPPAWAGITIAGTDAEKQEIQQAIDNLKNTSATAKSLFDELEARPESVTIRFGKTSDLATADSSEVILNKEALQCLKQIGEGKALEASSLGHTIAHEALGHTLGILKGLPESKRGEAAAVGVENKIRQEQGLPKQVKTESKDGRETILFSDGSRLDVTDALEKSRTGFLRIQGDAVLALSASLNDQGFVNLTLDPNAGTQQLALDLARFGGDAEFVTLLSLTADLTSSTESEDFNLEVVSLSLVFDSFLLGGEPTGTNFIDFLLPERTSIGNWDFSGGGQDFSFEFAGDFLWSNQLFQNLKEDGYVLQSFAGAMAARSGTEWAGTATVAGGMYGPGPIPEPSTLTLLGIGTLGLLGYARRRRKRVAA